MSEKKKRKAIVFLDDQMKLAEDLLSEQERGRLYESLRVYAMSGKEVESCEERKEYRSVYSMMKAAQDDAIAKYEEMCKRNRKNARKRSQRVAATGSQYNRIEENRIKDNRREESVSSFVHDGYGGFAGEDAPAGDEVKGVPGIVWR